MKTKQPVIFTAFVITAVVAASCATTMARETYKIGDYGPAGGIVFYDKGNYSGGWRYLEAAPAETEFRAEWGPVSNAWGFIIGKNVEGTKTQVGSGKHNTELILKKFRQLKVTGYAAQLCADLDFYGFKDWFLPSNYELDLMYCNLRQDGLGGFSNGSYWSSSEDSLYYNNADARSFNDGTLFMIGKSNTCSVRAIRAF